ncbi:MAG: VacJ family lipoprotein [Gammaproteobacteria bacterium]|nr:VacJ family lipoprotein [Gammaproteobacteria bacterium]MBT8105325.1 VacJ family lipoprotein [Gammaproteobacteria bacterium]NNK25339.1 VacJ family lipoprotein [Woeseiaceae bacterium]
MKSLACILTTVLLTAGCAATPEDQRVDHDPLEGLNRGIYGINDALDRALTKPIARGYQKIVPEPARKGVTNFSNNLFTPRSALNNFLQGKPRQGFGELSRFVLNSTFGLAGLVDVAAASGLEANAEDFGQTLAVWGAPPGPYLVLPFRGPTTLRDALMMPLDIQADPLYHYENTSVRDKLYVLRLINLRARLLALDEMLADSADPYVTIRESYLQNREFEIYDGDPPVDEEEDDLFDEFFEDEDY